MMESKRRPWTAAEKELIDVLSTKSDGRDELSPQTITSYENLYRMLTATTGKDLGESITQANASHEKLKSKYKAVSTRKSIVTAVNALITRHPDIVDKKATTLWRGYQKSLKMLDNFHRNNNVATPALLEKTVDIKATKAKADDLGKTTFYEVRESMRHLILLMMTDMPPKRADFGELRVHTRRPRKENEGNYVVVPSTGAVTLVLNEFKTAKSHDPIKETLPKSVADALRKSLKQFPRDYVFVGRDDEPMKPEAYGKFVTSTFEMHTGKKAGVTALRRAYITQMVDTKTMTMEQLEAIATSMGHTTKEQTRYNLVVPAKKAKK